MPHTLAEPLFQYLLQAFPASRAYPPAFFDQDPMPPAVAHFLHKELAGRLERDTQHLSAAPEGWFDEHHPDVRAAHEAFRKTLQRHARIPEDAWANTLREAAHTVTAFLVRPVPTLTAFVFGDQDEARSVLTLFHRLDYFTAYPYLREAVKAYIDQRNLHEMERDRFTTLLHHVDRQMAEDYRGADWVRLLRPLYELAGAVPRLNGGLPPKVLAAFFEEKDASALHQLLEDRAAQTAAPLTPDALQELLDREPAPEAAPEAPAPSPRPERAPDASEGPVPLWKQFRQQAHQEPAARPQPRPQASPSQPASAPAEASGSATPRWQQFRARPAGATSPASSSSGPVPASFESLERSILGERGPKNRDLFVKHLFGGSMAEYERVLHRLQTTSTWQQASQLIAQDVFRKQQVNIYSEPAVAFTEAVEAHFRR